MQNKNASNAGFTLLELLIVVLIAGVLVSIAVPSYQKAVYKAEMAEVLDTFHQIRQAMEVYHMANGTWPTDLNELGIDFPPTGNGIIR